MQEQRRSLPSLDLLRGFEAAARNLSFTKAAAELFVTQSAVSRQVKTIEEHVGPAPADQESRSASQCEDFVDSPSTINCFASR